MTKIAALSELREAPETEPDGGGDFVICPVAGADGRQTVFTRMGDAEGMLHIGGKIPCGAGPHLQALGMGIPDVGHERAPLGKTGRSIAPIHVQKPDLTCIVCGGGKGNTDPQDRPAVQRRDRPADGLGFAC